MRKTVTFEKVGQFVIDPDVKFILDMDENRTTIDCELLGLHCYGFDLDMAMDDLLVQMEFVWENYVEGDRTNMDSVAKKIADDFSLHVTKDLDYIPDRIGPTTDFVPRVSELYPGLLSAIAMLNSFGVGNLYIGISRNGYVVGTDVNDCVMDTMKDRIRSVVGSNVDTRIATVVNDGKTIIAITFRGNDIPYMSEGAVPVREGTKNVMASPDRVRSMVLSRTNNLLTQRRSRVKELTFSSLASFLLLSGKDMNINEKFFDEHHLRYDGSDYNEVAMLLSDQNFFNLNVVRFRGKDKSKMIGCTDFGHRCLLVSVRGIIDYVQSLDITRVEFPGTERKETYLFDRDAMKEAVLNACVHNSWIDDLPPSVFIFDDRIEVFSYCRKNPLHRSREQYHCGTRPVNRALYDMFLYAGLQESRGNGMRTIIDRCGIDCIRNDGTFFTVTIPFSFEPEWVITEGTSHESKEISMK